MEFYSRDGSPVAYLYDDEYIYSFRGKYLGWYENGWIFDRSGRRAFYTVEATGGPAKPSRRAKPAKGARRARPAKSGRSARSARSAKSMSWSSVTGLGYFNQ